MSDQENSGNKVVEALKKGNGHIFNPVNIKILTIGFLILVLLIPASMFKSQVWERKSRKAEAVREISGKWGGEQTISGPVLTVPYREYYKDEKGEQHHRTEYIHFLPEEVNVAGNLTPEVRYRGIYEAVLYNARVKFDGRFAWPDPGAFGVPPEHVEWDMAFLSLGVPDMTGIKERIDVRMGDATTPMNPGIQVDQVFKSGISARLPKLEKGREIPFAFDLDINGSQRFSVAPVGEVTTLSLTSPWPSPSFTGSFLPETREVRDDGFSAHWRVLHLNRNFPQAWVGPRFNVNDSSFGVKLFIAADVYQKATRTAKYALMFISLTFAVFFLAEVMSRLRVHPLQYLFVGLGLVIFYSLVLAISEHINFDAAYVMSALAMVALITAYTQGVFRHRMLTITIGSVLTILYGYLYMVLQLEDYALLMGSLGLFTVLAAAMYLTRKVDWYGIRFGEDDR